MKEMYAGEFLAEIIGNCPTISKDVKLKALDAIVRIAKNNEADQRLTDYKDFDSWLFTCHAVSAFFSWYKTEEGTAFWDDIDLQVLKQHIK